MPGRAHFADVLADDGYRTLANTLNRVGEPTMQHGLCARFHHLVDSSIETHLESERLASLVDRSPPFQGLDIIPEVLAEGVANG